ncbi:DUF502 domain-containing protein [Tumidithrix elongata RA019]|uniref:DUF502 domain-containing protein n=1 Tax=Tumidithrix elongata BACA0141 TaxID=2716417 RepID=A0AAW9PVK6_9CYAN|nr:DUF502 domain-containing protein [Tumidithrix elongata RA019]
MSVRKSNLKAESTFQERFVQAVKNDLIAGLLVIIPLATTIWLTLTIAAWSIDLLTRIPKQLNPLMGLHPLLINLINLLVGLAVPLASLLLVGLMARNFVGQWLLKISESLLQSIPLAGAVYKTLKQLLQTLLQDSNEKFRRVVLVEYPRRGIWRIAFVTGEIGGEIEADLEQSMLSIFLPTTPNPTNGWYAIVPEMDVVNLSMSVEDAFKLIISAGIVLPEQLIPTATKVPLNELELPQHEVQLRADQ